MDGSTKDLRRPASPPQQCHVDHAFVSRFAVFMLGAVMLGIAALADLDLPGPLVALLMLLGAFFVLMALFFDRVEKIAFSYGKTSISTDLSRVVGVGVAKELDDAGIARRVDAYSFVHTTLGTDARYSAAKVKLQDALVDDVRKRTFATPPDRAAVSKLAKGSAAERALAVGFLRGDPSLVTIEALRSAIGDSQSGNEQYHALLAGQDSWAHLNGAERVDLLEIVRTRRYANEDPERDGVAAEILTLGKG